MDIYEVARYRIYPNLPAIIKRAFWKVYLVKVKTWARIYGIVSKDRTLKIGKVVSVDPNKIVLSSRPSRHELSFRNIGIIKSGDWDLTDRKFDDSPLFAALRSHFLEGVPFSESELYRSIVHQTEKGIALWGCRTKAEYDARCESINELYYRIRDHGYKTQEELGESNLLHEINLKVGRQGELLFEEGEHRLAIAKLLGIKSVPVIITKRHSEWVRFRQEILDYARQNSGRVYHPLTHPDLTDIPSVHGEDRWNLIFQSLPLSSGTMLDIGAQWGYFCHKFEDIGFGCFAVENNPTELYFLNRLKLIENKKFEIIPKSIFDMRKKDYDVVLALNIFHHFLKTRRDYEKLTKLLRDLRMKFMYFEPCLPGERQMTHAYAKYSEAEFINYILENSCLKTCELLGRDQDGRAILLLTA